MFFKYKGIDVEIPDKFLKHHAGVTVESRIHNGTYEADEYKMLKEVVDKDSVILELGGSVGILACLTAKLMNNQKNLVVVEAHPYLIPVLKNNMERNSLDFNIFHGIAHNNNNEIKFNYNEYPLNGHIFGQGGFGETGETTLPGTTPMDLENKYNLRFNTLNCDIEGSEYMLLDTLYDYFSNYKCLIVEFHGWGTYPGVNRDTIEKKYSNIFNIKRSHSVTQFTKK